MKTNQGKKAIFAFASALAVFILTGSLFGQSMFRKVNDFDGDGKADYAVTRNIDGYKYWYVWQSTAGFRVFQWGLNVDKEISGDYDGDGKVDFAINRTEAGHEIDYIYQSATSTYISSASPVNNLQFHEPVPQDYDGDGKFDRSDFYQFSTPNPETTNRLFRYYRSSVVPSTFRDFVIDPGQTFLRLGDMTGDGISEIVTFTSSSRTVTIKNPETNAVRTVQFGIAGDQFVPGDFDGDGKGDIAIFRESNGTWWWLRSSDNALYAAQFGQAGDKPVPADYDGDGKTDLAIWRPGTTQSVFWVYGSLGNVTVFPFGVGTDKVVTY